jgi:elongation factor Tu
MGLFDKLFGSKNSPEAADFSMKAESVFGISGRGTIVAGMVQTGTIANGNTVYLTSVTGEMLSCRVQVEVNQEKYPGLKEAEAGMNIGLLLAGVEKDKVAEGVMIYGSPK